MKTLDLALIGNGTIGALIDAQATVNWACWPRFDGDPVFCALLKDTDDYGFFSVELADCERTEQHYLENTAILVTRLVDRQGGAIEVTDFAPRFGQHGRTFRPMMLVRRLRRLTGSPRLTLRLRPACSDGAARPAVTWGSNHIRYVGPDAGAAADHRRIADGHPAGDAVLSRRHGDAAAGRGRNRARGG